MAAKRKPGGRLNALRDGIFAKELLIPGAGECRQEFDKLRSRLWNDYAPEDVATEMLVEDLLNTYWRLRRIRRFEDAEIRKQVETARCRRKLEQLEQFQTRKNKFFEARYRLALNPNLPEGDRLALERSFAEIRRGLASTVLGTEFLTKQVEDLKSEVKIYGYLRPYLETLLLQVCGLEADHLHGILQLNQLAKNARQKLHRCEEKQVQQDEVNVANKNEDPSSMSEVLKILYALKQNGQEATGKVQPPENRRVERDPGKAVEKNADSLSAAESNARARGSMQAAMDAIDAQMKKLSPLARWLAEQDSTETGMGANGGGRLQEILRTMYDSLEDGYESYQLEEKHCAKQEEKNSADEKAALSSANEFGFMLSAMLNNQVELLKQIKIQLQSLEAAEEASEPATLLLLPPEAQDRIHRAEAPLQRQRFKILDRLDARKGIGTKKPSRE